MFHHLIVVAGTLNVTLFARNLPAPVFALRDFRTGDAIIVANCDGIIVIQIRRLFVELLPGLDQALK